MENIVKSLSSIFEKISDFFDLFDLSFFVSGAIASSAIFLWMHLAKSNPLVELEGGLKILAVILAFYISGLVCFAVGRWVRIGIFSRQKYDTQFDQYFKKVLEAHGLASQEPFQEYLGRESRESQGSIWRLYTRLWAEARQCPALAPSLSLLKRYWVMAATYDGVAVATVVWIAVFFSWCLGDGLEERLDWKVGAIVILLLAFVSKSCMREAGRYVNYQVEELVASIAAQRAKEIK
ncbi:MAG: hypothetical protein AB4426_25860 [Xenococcaceae cyanobacterium]